MIESRGQGGTSRVRDRSQIKAGEGEGEMRVLMAMMVLVTNVMVRYREGGTKQRYGGDAHDIMSLA